MRSIRCLGTVDGDGFRWGETLGLGE